MTIHSPDLLRKSGQERICLQREVPRTPHPKTATESQDDKLGEANAVIEVRMLIMINKKVNIRCENIIGTNKKALKFRIYL